MNKCEIHKEEPDYSCNTCCSKIMGDLDKAIMKSPRLARQMDNSNIQHE